MLTVLIHHEALSVNRPLKARLQGHTHMCGVGESSPYVELSEPTLDLTHFEHLVDLVHQGAELVSLLIHSGAGKRTSRSHLDVH